MSGTLTVSGLVAGLLSGEKVIGPVTVTGGSTVGTILDVALSAGDNTINVPAGAAAVLIVLPSSNTQVLKLRTNLDASDAGVSLAARGFVVLTLAPGVSSLIVNSPGVTSLEANFI